MKKNTFVRVICLIVAGAVLGSALIVAAVMGSPYETLKRALMDAITYRNVTVEGMTTVTVDGVVQQAEKTHYVNGDDSALIYYFDNDGNQSGFSYRSHGLNVYQSHQSESGAQWFQGNLEQRDPYRYPSPYYYSGGFGAIRPEERESAQMRFAELAVDALVGDLKNNVTMSSSNGIRYIQGTLTENQVPELAKAALDMFAEQSSNRWCYYEGEISFDGRERVYEQIRVNREIKTVSLWKQMLRAMTLEEITAWEDGSFYDKYTGNGEYWGVQYMDGWAYIVTEPMECIGEYTAPATREDYENYSYTLNPMDMPMKSLTINYVHGEAEIDADGNLLSLNVNGTATVTNIFGDTHVVEMDVSMRFSDIGTSDPVCPIPGVEELLTPDFMKNLIGREWGTVFFALNADGSINADSVTTTYPGELERFLGMGDGVRPIVYEGATVVEHTIYDYDDYDEVDE